MGLDMMAMKVKKEEIGNWRKHNRLHGWMESRWRELGNEGTFNSGAFLYLDLKNDQNEKILETISSLEELDDVQSVYTNVNLKRFEL